MSQTGHHEHDHPGASPDTSAAVAVLMDDGEDDLVEVDEDDADVRFTVDPLAGFDLKKTSPSLRPHIEAARDLAARSLAPSTHQSYLYAWRRWARWCRSEGFDPHECDPADLVIWLTELTVDLEAAAPLTRGRIRPASLSVTLGAIDRVAKTYGLAPPSHHPTVQVVVQGIRRSFGMAPVHQRAAIELEMLRELAAHLQQPQQSQIRDAALVALRGNGVSLAGCSGRSKLGLRWRQVCMSDDGVEVRSSTTGERPLLLTGADAHALAAWRASGESDSQAVFDLSRQGVADAVNRSITLAGLRADIELVDPHARERIYTALGTPSNAQLRDRALLIFGWFTALRRSNLAALRWCDITAEPGGLSVWIERSKGDQEGHGNEIWVPRTENTHVPCAVTALAAYAERLQAEGFGNLVGSPQPLFVQVDRHDRIMMSRDGFNDGISGQAINDIISRIVEDAGYDPKRFGAHSLRAGFITTAFSLGISAADIQLTSLHKSIEVLSRYNRPSDRKRRSAAAHIAAAPPRSPDPIAPHHPLPSGPPKMLM